MVKIINPFFQPNPLAEAIKGFGQTMFGDTLTPAVNRQKLRDAQRAEFGTEALARIFGTSDGTTDPAQVSEMGILAGMKPEDAAMWNVFMAGNKLGPRATPTTNAMAGAGKYRESAENLDFDRSNAFNMNESDNVTLRFNNAADNTRALQTNAADNDRALTLGREGYDLDWRKFFYKPEEALVDGKPGFATQGALAGNPAYGDVQLGQPAAPGAAAPSYAPIPKNTEKSPVDMLMGFMEAFKVANPGSTPEQQRTWALQQIAKSRSKGITIGPDGTVQIGGEAGYDPTNTMTTEGQREAKSLDNFKFTLKEAQRIASEDPTIFGATGTGRRMFQGATQLASNMALMFGATNAKEAIDGLRLDLMARGFDGKVLDPKLDPNLYDIEAVATMLAYSAAEAMAGQEGRSVSDQDVLYWQKIVGDPTALLSSQEYYQSRLNMLDRHLKQRIEINKKYTGKQNLPADAATQPAPAATTSVAPPSTKGGYKILSVE